MRKRNIRYADGSISIQTSVKAVVCLMQSKGMSDVPKEKKAC